MSVLTLGWLACTVGRGLLEAGARAATPSGQAAAIATLDEARAGSFASSSDPGVPGSRYPIQFEDVTRASGVRFAHASDLRRGRSLATIGGGVAAADLDGDGLPELFFTGTVRDGRRPERGPASVLYRNRGDGTFEDRTRSSGTGERGWLMGAYLADLDADGSADLLLTASGGVRILWNAGAGVFRQGAWPAGIADDRWSVGAAFLDADRDGRLDVVIGRYLDTDYTREQVYPMFQVRTPADYAGLPNALFLQKEARSFVDATEASGASAPGSKTLGLCAQDLDGDGIDDLLVANDRTPNMLFCGRGDGTFEDVSAAWGIDEITGRTGARAGMGIAVGDPDGDGDPDLVVTNFGGEPVTYYRNTGGGLFEDATAEAGLVPGTLPYVQWGAHLEDLDNDGNPDLTIVSGHLVPRILSMMAGLLRRGGAGPYSKGRRSYRQPMVLYRGSSGGIFHEVTASSADLARMRVSGRGSITADFDGDGLLDLAVHSVSGGCRVLRNTTTDPGHAIEILPEPAPPGEGTRPATVVGTRIAVSAGGRRWMREFGVSCSYASGSWLPLHFGLGTARTVDRLEIYRPGETAPSAVYTAIASGAVYGVSPSGLRRIRAFRPRHEGSGSPFSIRWGSSRSPR